MDIDYRLAFDLAPVGLVLSRWRVSNQHGEDVMTMQGWGMFGRRAPATPQELAQLEAQRAAS